jgi:predicted outer membrane repeat protein
VVAVLAAFAAVAAFPVSRAGAATMVVVTEAELKLAFATAPGGTEIQLGRDITLSRASCPITRSRPAGDTVTIGSQPSASGRLRRFKLAAGACDDGIVRSENVGSSLTIHDLTITGGRSSSNGGAILVAGSLSVANSALSDNTSSGDGGAIAAGSVTVTDSILRDNRAAGDGGAIESPGDVTVTSSTLRRNTAVGAGGAIESSGSVTVTSSSFNNNTATGTGVTGGGGAIDAPKAQASVTSSTLSGNTTAGNGGAIRAGAVGATNSTLTGNAAHTEGGAISSGLEVTLVFATVVANTAPDGSNLRWGGTLSTYGSVITRSSRSEVQNCLGGHVASQGFNLTDEPSCVLDQLGDREASDPRLGSLTDNGGPTETMSPGAKSPLVDAIPLVAGQCQGEPHPVVTTDQRGLPRPARARCDIGGVEVQPRSRRGSRVSSS